MILKAERGKQFVTLKGNAIRLAIELLKVLEEKIASDYACQRRPFKMKDKGFLRQQN